MNYSIVQFVPDRSAHLCGYCKSKNGSLSDGLWAHTMMVQDYQDLIDRGWRRSGQFCYKPKMDTTCCPAYTIRCAAMDIHLTKSQKKILKKVRKFLIDGKRVNCEDKECWQAGVEGGECESERIRLENAGEAKVDIDMKHMDFSMMARCGAQEDTGRTMKLPSSSSDETIITPSSASESTSSEMPNQKSIDTSHTNQKKNPHSGLGPDLSKPKMKKAKLIRLERREKKQMAKTNSEGVDHRLDSIASKTTRPQGKTLEDFINDPLPADRKHNLEVRLVNLTVDSPSTTALLKEELELYQKYQVAIHKDAIDKCNASQFNNFLVQSPLQIKLVRSGSKELDEKLEWSLFAKYQMSIHKDKPEDCSITDFSGFLIESPLKSQEDQQAPATGYGSFHQQYWLDGKLIAVGVIDVLPICVSSVYFFYDPDYSFLSLGTYSSLREVDLVRSLNKSCPSLMYYYMGFYIHSCPKMRYKGKIGPSFLLCPKIYSWIPIESCLPKLDKDKYSILDDDPDAVSKDSNIDLNRVLILWKNVTVDYARFKRLNKKPFKADVILNYANLVGKTCSQRMLLYQ